MEKLWQINLSVPSKTFQKGFPELSIESSRESLSPWHFEGLCYSVPCEFAQATSDCKQSHFFFLLK